MFGCAKTSLSVSSRFAWFTAEKGDLVLVRVAQITNVELWSVSVPKPGFSFVKSTGSNCCSVQMADLVLVFSFKSNH